MFFFQFSTATTHVLVLLLTTTYQTCARAKGAREKYIGVLTLYVTFIVVIVEISKILM